MNHWKQLRILARMIGPTSVQILAAFLPIVIYITFAQGAEVLSMLAEAFRSKEGMFVRPALFFLLANGLAGFAIWWSARLMMEFRFNGVPEPEGWARKVADNLQRYWPRILGVLPVLIVAAAFFIRIGKYDKPADRLLLWSLGVLGGLHAVLALLLVIFFWQRRQWLKNKAVPASYQRFDSFSAMARASKASRWTNVGLLGISTGVLAALWIRPIVIAQWLGTGAMFSIGAVAFVTIGTLLMNLRARTGVPVVTLLVLWVLFCSWAMDNHDLRVSPGHSLSGGLTVEEAFKEWRAEVERSSPPGGAAPKLRPVFIVATEGGGIRAAYWTAQVLGALQEASIQALPLQAGQSPHADFASHLFAISGVSGGSVGAAVFNALLVDQRERRPSRRSTLTEDAHLILGQDHLAPLLGALLFPAAVHTTQRHPSHLGPMTQVHC